MGVYQAIKQVKLYTQRQLQLTHRNFVILNNHIKDAFKVYQKRLLLGD